MKDSSASIPLRDLVFVGGGHAHVHVLKMLGMQNLDNLRITLISRDLLTPYSGMIPGYVCGYYTKEECHLDLYRLCSFANVRYIHAEVHHIDTTQKLIYCQDLGATAASTRPPIRYDILSIDIGISPTLSYTSADPSHITAVKPIDKFADRWEAILTKVDAYCKQIQGSSASSREKTCFKIAVVGGGSGGVELSFAMHYRLHTLLTERGIDSKDVVKVCLLNKGASVMSNHGK